MSQKKTVVDDELVEEPRYTMEDIATKLREKFIEAAMTQANAADPEQLVNEVVKDLNAAKNEVTLKLLGLTNSWGRWEVSGSQKDNLIDKMIDADGRELVRNWVQEAIKEVFTEEAKSAYMKRVKGEIKKYLKENLLNNYNLRDASRKLCDEMTMNAVNELRAELSLSPVSKNRSY